jgi:hypothetical protein
MDVTLPGLHCIEDIGENIQTASPTKHLHFNVNTSRAVKRYGDEKHVACGLKILNAIRSS